MDNKIDGWKIRLGGSIVTLFGGVRGVIIPHQFVRAISDVFIINKAALPSPNEVSLEASSEEDLI